MDKTEAAGCCIDEATKRQAFSVSTDFTFDLIPDSRPTELLTRTLTGACPQTWAGDAVSWKRQKLVG